MIIENNNNIVVISTSASSESVSRKALPILIDVFNTMSVPYDVFDIRDFPPIWVDNRDIADYPSQYQNLFESVKQALGVIFLVPIYCYTASSAAKAISEIIGDALECKPVGFIVSAGTLRSHLGIADFMKSMAFEQETYCYPKYVLLNKVDCSESGILVNEANQRVTQMATGFLQYSKLFPYQNQI